MKRNRSKGRRIFLTDEEIYISWEAIDKLLKTLISTLTLDSEKAEVLATLREKFLKVSDS